MEKQQIRVIKKKDEYSMDYQIGDIFTVDSMWYGGVNVLNKLGIPLSLDQDEYEIYSKETGRKPNDVSSGGLEILEYTGIGYQPVLACRDWRVAVLNYHEELLPENIDNFQKHMLTDEVFVLLRGSCILFLAEDESLKEIRAVKMEPCKIYNVKQGTYHTHTLSEDAMVLIVEAEDTCDDNSPKAEPNGEVTKRLIELTRELSEER